MLASVLTKVEVKLTRRGCSQVALRSLSESAILDLSQACHNLIDEDLHLYIREFTVEVLVPKKRK